MFDSVRKLSAVECTEVVYTVLKALNHRHSGRVPAPESSEGPSPERLALSVLRDIEAAEGVGLSAVNSDTADRYAAILSQIALERRQAEFGYDAEQGRRLLRQLRNEVAAVEPETRLDLNAAVLAIVSTLRPLVGPGIDLQVRLGEHLPEVPADPWAVRQVLINLILNSVRFISRPGRVIIETSASQSDATSDEVALTEVIPQVRLTVREDKSAGTMRRIFEPFFTPT